MNKAARVLWCLLLLAPSRARLRGTPPARKRKPATRPPVPMLPCADAEAPTVSDAGQLRSADVALDVEKSGEEGVAFTTPLGTGRYAAFDAAALRSRTKNLWLSFAGDSSLRGLYLSLLQQLMDEPGSYSFFDGGDEFYVADEWMAKRDPGAAAGERARSPDRDSLAMGFVDAIVRDGALRWMRSAFHDGSHGWRRSGPGPDRSGELSDPWCGGGGGATRVTFRMLTTVDQSLRGPLFDGLNATCRPDVHVLEFGAWDRQLPAERGLERRMEALVAGWVAAAAPSTRLVFASIPRGWEALDGARPRLAACLEGSWARTVLARFRVAYLNRVLVTDALRASALARDCPCLADHTYHPPHIANVLDVVRLANVLFPAAPAEDAATRLAVRGGLRNCCCALPPANVSGGSLAYWARVCRLVPGR